jgi:predicted phage tail protein
MFTGLTSATLSDANIVLSWDPASDDATPPEEIAFAIYSGAQTGGEDFSTPYAFTPAGATGAVVSNLASTQTYFWVVRAVDGSGNQDANTVEKEATPPDLVPPRFAGATKVTADSSHSLLVEWKPAHDNATSTVNMSYEVFVSASPDISSFDFKTPNATSDAGQSSVEITGLDPETPYYVIARAVDQAGLVDDNTYVQTATTPEGVPPSFAGIKQVDALPEGVKLYWLSATDNATDVANITYDIYVSPTNTDFAGATPTYQTDAGVLSFVVPNLTNQKRYWFMVRARDLSGNTDNNSKVISARRQLGHGDIGQSEHAPRHLGHVHGRHHRQLASSLRRIRADRRFPARVGRRAHDSERARRSLRDHCRTGPTNHPLRGRALSRRSGQRASEQHRRDGLHTAAAKHRCRGAGHVGEHGGRAHVHHRAGRHPTRQTARHLDGRGGRR